MNRRGFITHSVAGMLVVNTPYNFAVEADVFNNEVQAKVLVNANNTVSPGLNRRQWKTIISVQEHLFPTNNRNNPQLKYPGAKEINAKAFLFSVLADAERDEEDRKLVKSGVDDLQEICHKKYRQSFIDLGYKEKEQSLRSLEKMPQGKPWLMTLLGYIFEALVTDPIYGGNPDQIGWKWLNHQAGFPRPSAIQKYYMLTSKYG